MCNAKSFVIAISVLIPFFFLVTFSGRNGKSYFQIFAALSTCDQDRSYSDDIACAFKPCPLGIHSNSNSRLKWEHLEYSSSATKVTRHMVLRYHVTTKIIISITRVSMATKLGRMITYLDGILSIKSHNSRSCEISNITVPMTTKLGKMVTHLEGLLTIN